ncbi:heme exporter protein CcmD [Pseudoroseicyclus tamaricis]|uniref:Heme exporter protein D n=1 Tax=Pseudoroseicyclus tamaricis TaxID=2705421 RepID=A0A6B2JVU6_9RHOB|nr:heme exporter protein CcmD [Pseudoroseicyclus tamaricis]NDV00769.1 heme exporter protein CcmD [Pseudoroseicyclus tamaricis]
MTGLLGDYAGEVISAYIVSLALIGGLVWLSALQARRARKQLKRAESRHG